MFYRFYIFIFLLSFHFFSFSQEIAYIIPDIGVANYSTSIEIIAPAPYYNSSNIAIKHFGNDGFYTNNFDSEVKVLCQNLDDNFKITISPLVVSWNGSLISVQIFVHENIFPNSSNWQELDEEFKIPLIVKVGDNQSAFADTFYIVQPQPALNSDIAGVLGSGNNMGIRSPRGAMIFENINLNGTGIYTISTNDCDPNTEGNQAYLPATIISLNDFNIGSNTILSLDADDKNAGVGGGGGGAGSKNGDGGHGFTSGGYSCNPNTSQGILSYSGQSTGFFYGLVSYQGNYSLNNVEGGFGSCDQGAGGGTGHPFGVSGSHGEVGTQPDEGAYGGGSAGGEFSSDNPPTFGGGGAGNSTDGEIGGGNTINNAGKVHGNLTITPFYGGSGGGAGNVWNAQKGGNGGGGGGAISLFAYKNLNILNKITANGGNGSDGTNFNDWASPDSSSGGGGGSGGNIILSSKIAHTGNFILEVNGGEKGYCGSGGNCNNSFDGGNGGSGRIRIDGNILGNYEIETSEASFYNGLSIDTLNHVNPTFTLKGTGNGNPIKIYIKSANTLWTEIASIFNYTNNTWEEEITLQGNDGIYFVMAMQQSNLPDENIYTMQSDYILSQAGSNILYVNRPPEAVIDAPIILENTSFVIDVQENDFDVNDNPLITNILEYPQSGIAILLNSDSIHYTPNENFNGTDSLMYEVCDNFGLCDTTMVYITVTPYNYPPEIIDENGNSIDTIFLTTEEEIPITICLEANDLGGDNLDITEVFSFTDNGIINLEPLGDTCFIYTPNENFNGFDTLEVIICDDSPLNLCDTVFVIIEVTEINDIPEIVDENGENIDTLYTTTLEDTPLIICPNIIDVDGDILDITQGFSLTGNSEIILEPLEDTCFVYVPNNNFNGIDTLIIFICDDNEIPLCDSLIVIVDVIAVDDIPQVTDENNQITDTIYLTTEEDIAIEICPNFFDADENTIEITEGDASNGNLILEPLSDSCFWYYPNENFTGLDTLEITYCDNSDNILCNYLTVIIDVTPINDIPQIIDEEGEIIEIINDTTNEDESITICLDFEDIENDLINISESSIIQNGIITINDTCFIYTPNENFYGLDSLLLIFCDEGSPVLCDTIDIFINVIPVNDTLIFTTNENTAITICNDILSNDNFTIISNFINGEITENLENDSCFTYLPNENFYGLDSLVLEVCRNEICDTLVIVIETLEINNPPQVVDIFGNATQSVEYSTPENTSIDICLDVEDEGDEFSLILLSLDIEFGNINITEAPCFTYTPNENFVGIETFEMIICDEIDLCDTFIVYINVTPVNHSPFANDDIIILTNTDEIFINVLNNDIDEDGDSIYVSTILSSPPYGYVNISNEGTILYTPDSTYFGQNGDLSFIYQVCDDVYNSICTTATVTLKFNFLDIPIDIPNSFSPNNDAINDVLLIEGLENIINNQLTIINRWGNIVFQTENYQNDWAGTYTSGSMRNQATGDKLPDGTYFYIFEAKDFNIIKTGYIILKK